MKLKIAMIVILLLVVFLIAWLRYATKANPKIASYTKGFVTQKVKTKDILNGKVDPQLMGVEEYAALAYIVYRREDMATVNSYLGWKRLAIPMELVKIKEGQKLVEEFYYELWEKEITATQTEVAIVFRGTQEAQDWIANARWLLKLLNRNKLDHYDQLHSISDSIISTIRRQYKNTNKSIKIVSTGHSLGGGLAQLMAYATPDVKRVYAFDPSPVTAYYDVNKKDRNENKKQVTIYRIFESGEFLSFVRKFMTVIFPAPFFKTENPALIRIRFSFKTGASSVFQHSMRDLAASLKKYKAIE